MNGNLNVENFPTLMVVVALALRRNDGFWLMHRRPLSKPHGGLWEFPGGKVEAGEVIENAMIREASEELGIEIEAQDVVAKTFAQGANEAGDQPIVILLYTCDVWRGEPRSIEGGEVGWFSPKQVFALEKPPLDIKLCQQLLGSG